MSRGSTGWNGVRRRILVRKISAVLALTLALALAPLESVAEEGHEGQTAKSGSESSTDHKGMDMGESGMQHGMNMGDMHTQMKGMHEHSKMMEGMTDDKALAEEMKKHMRMMDEMMEKILQRQLQAGAETTP